MKFVSITVPPQLFHTNSSHDRTTVDSCEWYPPSQYLQYIDPGVDLNGELMDIIGIIHSTLWQFVTQLLNMGIYSGFTITHGDFLQLCKGLPEGSSFHDGTMTVEVHEQYLSP